MYPARVSYALSMEIPKKGDTVVRTDDGARFTVAEIVEAGGENLYRLQPADGGETVEVEGGVFTKRHDAQDAEFTKVG